MDNTGMSSHEITDPPLNSPFSVCSSIPSDHQPWRSASEYFMHSLQQIVKWLHVLERRQREKNNDVPRDEELQERRADKRGALPIAVRIRPDWGARESRLRGTWSHVEHLLGRTQVIRVRDFGQHYS